MVKLSSNVMYWQIETWINNAWCFYNTLQISTWYSLAVKVRSHDPILSDPIVLDPIVLDPIVLDPIVGSCEHMNNWIQLFIVG